MTGDTLTGVAAVIGSASTFILSLAAAIRYFVPHRKSRFDDDDDGDRSVELLQELNELLERRQERQERPPRKRRHDFALLNREAVA